MSSRSFRRRNNRRRQKPGGAVGDPSREPRAKDPARDASPPAGDSGADGAKPGGQGPRQPNRRERGRRDGRGPVDRQRGEKPREPSVARPLPECPICGRPVRELAAALTHRPTGAPAHFDCILKELRDTNELAPQEKLCYLGGGTFGILQFRPSGGANRFTIRKRIPYEEKDSHQEWKKTLLVSR